MQDSTSWASLIDCNGSAYALSSNWPFDQPHDDLISPETLAAWTAEDYASFRSSVDGLDLFNHAADVSIPPRDSARASHGSGGSILEGGNQQGLVHLSGNDLRTEGSCIINIRKCFLAKLIGRFPISYTY